MKNTKLSLTSLRIHAALFAALYLAAGMAQAATFYWDMTGATPGFGTAGGTWAQNSTTTGRWTTSSTGSIAGSATQTTANTDAFNFGSLTDNLGAGTITVSGSVTMGNTTFHAGSGAIVLNSGTAINYAASASITINNAQDTINTPLGSTMTGTFTKAGSGILILGGNNSYTAATSITGGTLRAGAAASGKAFGANSAVTLANTAGVTLDLNGFSQTIGSLAGGGATGGNVTLGSGSAVLTTGNNNSSTSFAGIISGTGTSALTKGGSGTLTLTGANTYAGITTINGGTIDLGGGTANGSLSSSTLTLAGGSFNYTRTGANTQTFATNNFNSSASGLTVSAGNILNLGTVARAAGVSYNFSNAGAGTVAADTTSNTNGIMAGFTVGDSWAVANGTGVAIGGLADGSYTKTSVAGTTAANYSNNHIDVDNSAGTLDGTITPNSLRFSSAATNTLTLATGVSTNGSGGILVGSLVGPNLSTITGGTLTGPTSKDLLVVQNNTSGGLTIDSTIANNTSTSLTKSGAGLLTLGGANTFTGGVFINGGNITLANAGALNSTAGSENAVTFGPATTGTLSLSSNSVVIKSLATDANTPGTAVVENASGSDITLTIGNSANASGAFGGVIQNGTGGGKLALTKTGTGTLTLSGANTYTGGTTISAGTVAANNSSAFGTGKVTVSGSSTLNFLPSLTLANDIEVNAALSVKDIMTTTTGNTITFNGVLSGSGAISVLNNGQNGAQGEFAFKNANNTWNGDVTMASGNAVGYDQFSFNSIGDAGKFTLQKSGNQNMIAYTGSSDITFNNRVLNIGAISGNFDGGGQNPVNMFANNGAGTVTFNTDMTVGAIANANSTLFFGGSNTGTNTFAGIIPNNSSGAGSFGIGKTGAGKWILTRLNSYTGEVLLRNGTLSVNAIDVAANNQSLGKNSVIQIGHLANTGTLEFTGGTDSTTDKQVRIGNANSNAGNNGGAVILNNGSGSLTFNNVTFNPTVATVTATRTLTLGGTNTGANTISGVIQDNVAGTGKVALTKADGGTWVLSGPNIYTGTTAVNAGTLLINGNSLAVTNRVTVNAGGTLGGTGTIGGTVTNLAGSKLAPGAGSGVAGTLTLTNGLGLNGAYLSFILTNANPGEYSQVSVTGGSMAVSGLNLIQLTAATNQIPDGTYVLITNVVSRTPSANQFLFQQTGTTNWVIGGATLTLLNGANSVELVVTNGPVAPVSTSFTWQGNLNTTWDTSTLNWQSNGVAQLYADGNEVLFNDAAITFTVTNGAGFSPNPGSVTFNNNISNYTVAVNIQGGGAVTNAGLGLNVLSGSNSYSGVTYVNAGILRIASTNALGSTSAGTIVSSSATLSSVTTMTNSGEALTLSGTGSTGANGALHVGGSKTWTWDGPVALAANAMIHSDGGATLVTSGTITGTGTDLTLDPAGTINVIGQVSLGTGGIIKTGVGSLTLASGANSYSGDLIQQSGGGITVSAAGAQGSGDIIFDGASASGAVTFNGFDGAITNNIISANGGTGGVTKSGATTNILTGNNTYVGATTISSSGGMLVGMTASAFGSSSNISIGSFCTLSLRGDSSTTFVKASDSTPYTVSYATGNNATIDVDQATPAGTSTNTMTIGALKAATTTANVTVVFTGTNNTSLSVGDVTGPAKLSATMSVTYSNIIASPGTLTLASFTSASGGTTTSDTLIFTGTGNTTVTGGITNTSLISLPLSLVKDGSGTLTLGGANAYTGNTTVSNGTLAIAVASIADQSTVVVTNPGVLQLNFAATNRVTALVLDGVTQSPGVYNTANSSPRITGTGSLLVNNPPVAANFALGVPVDGSVVADVVGKYATDVDVGDALTITNVSTPTNGTVSIVGGTNLLYTSTNAAAGDSFTYTVSDGLASATGTVTVTTYNPEGFNRISPPSVIDPGTVVLTFLGIPNEDYALEHTTNLTPTILWSALITNTAATNGYLTFTNTSSAPQNYFRTRHVP